MKGDTPHCQSLSTEQQNIVSIMRDIAEGKQNLLGDYWDRSFCNDAANEIERLQAGLVEINKRVNEIQGKLK